MAECETDVPECAVLENKSPPSARLSVEYPRTRGAFVSHSGDFLSPGASRARDESEDVAGSGDRRTFHQHLPVDDHREQAPVIIGTGLQPFRGKRPG